MLDGGESAPRDNLFDILWLVQFLLERLIAALPIGDRNMLGDWVLRRHFRHSAGNCERGKWIVCWRFNDRITASDSIANDRCDGHHGAIARDDVKATCAEGASERTSSIPEYF